MAWHEVNEFGVFSYTKKQIERFVVRHFARVNRFSIVNIEGPYLQDNSGGMVFHFDGLINNDVEETSGKIVLDFRLSRSIRTRKSGVEMDMSVSLDTEEWA